jgi:hypothetical protein
MLSFKKSTKVISDVFNPSKFIYSNEELSSSNRLTPDARLERQKDAKEERLLELLSLYMSNDRDSQVHLYDRQQSEIIRDYQRSERAAQPATSEESQG